MRSRAVKLTAKVTIPGMAVKPYANAVRFLVDSNSHEQACVMLPKVHIDGHVGTTGLRIRDWLAGRRDIELSTLDEERRKDDAARRTAMEAADLAVLCLPDDAAREAAQWAGECGTRVIDASTAHRVADGWTYGLPEVQATQRDAIREARFVANPGCYPSAFILLTRPLVDGGLLPHDTPVSIHALSGYSGGGRGLIEKWESAENGLGSLPYEAPYALGARHKHVPEMMAYSGLTTEPQFVPAVGPFRCGMRVEVPIHLGVLPMGVNSTAILDCLRERYDAEPFIRVVHHPDPREAHERSFDPQVCNDTNSMELHVVPHPSGHTLLVALLDNLGKGASGVAIQNLNLMLGLPETAHLPE